MSGHPIAGCPLILLVVEGRVLGDAFRLRDDTLPEHVGRYDRDATGTRLILASECQNPVQTLGFLLAALVQDWHDVRDGGPARRRLDVFERVDMEGPSWEGEPAYAFSFGAFVPLDDAINPSRLVRRSRSLIEPTLRELSARHDQCPQLTSRAFDVLADAAHRHWELRLDFDRSWAGMLLHGLRQVPVTTHVADSSVVRARVGVVDSEEQIRTFVELLEQLIALEGEGKGSGT